MEIQKLSKESVALLSLAFLLLIGVVLGFVRHAKKGDIQLQEVQVAPLRLNINQASVKELTRLPGIGEGLAERIIKYRESHGDFLHPESLLSVPGIGKGKYSEIKPYLEVP